MPLLHRLTTLTAVAAGSAAMIFAVPDIAGAAPGEHPGQSQTAGVGDLLGSYQAATDALRAFGMDPFLYPTAAAFCSGNTAAGLVPAVAGAVPGPWPKTTLTIPGLDLSAVKAGQTLFTFVPYGLGPDTANVTGMRVAWLNLTNGRSGFTAMGPLSEVFKAMVPAEVPAEIRPLAERAIYDFFTAALPIGGVRAVPVDTGTGTVLAAVLGTVDNGGKSCFFLPTVGITTVK